MPEDHKIPLPGAPVRGSRSGAPIMALLDLLGRRWALGIMWILAKEGGQSFSSLQEKCETISPGVLTGRLKELQIAQLIERSGRNYVLSALGKELFWHIQPLGLWARERWAQAFTAESPAE